MELTSTYIASQIFVLIMYTLIATTYFCKSRTVILILNFLSLVSISITYILLNAWTGFALTCVAILRNVIFLIDEKKNGKSNKIFKKDILILLFLYIISILLAIITYNGFFSLFHVLGTMVYTYSVWQKKTDIYKILGIPAETCSLIYNIYIFSLFGIVFDSILVICSITGYCLDIKSKK